MANTQSAPQQTTTPSMSNIHVLELSKYTTPSIIEDKRKEFVAYGDDNDYFTYLIDKYTCSATNNAIISAMCNIIYGKGLSARDARRKPEQYAQMKGLLKPYDTKNEIFDRKLLGMAAIQVTIEGKKVKSITHYPMKTLRPAKMNDNGEIEEWFYHPNWADYKPNDDLDSFKVFDPENVKSGNYIKIVKSYMSGYDYFSLPDYIGAVPYAEAEGDISDYLLNDIKNGFSGTKVINFNNGVPDEEKQREIKRDVLKKVTGARGAKVIVAFNDNQESSTTVEDIPLNDAPAHYEYLAKECRQKLLEAHKSPSWLLGTNNGGQGLGSNADEIKNQMLVFQNNIIRAFQDELIDAYKEILAVNDINLDLYFIPINPLEGEDTGQQVTMSEDIQDFNDAEMLDALQGESLDDEWELVDEREHSLENSNIEDWANSKIKPKLSIGQKLARAIKSAPNKESALDKSYYKIRYKYAEKYSSGNSRDFCKVMMGRTDRGVVYRKEDIDQASFRGVNKEFGHKGRAYSLFKYKGGVNCGHYWVEQLYRLKKKTDGSYVDDKALSSSDKVEDIPSSYKPSGEQYTKSEIAPKDMPNNGHHPAYKG